MSTSIYPEDRLQAVQSRGCNIADGPASLETVSTSSVAEYVNLATIGNFGSVYLVCHEASQSYYAMKVLDRKDLKRRRQLEHTESEIEVLHLASKSPFLTHFHYFICMEFCQGGELFRLLRDLGRMNQLMSAFYAGEVIAAIEFLHNNDIAYRDLKPENVLIAKDGHIKLCDFGFAKKLDGKSWTLCGTPEYLAPEIILGTGHDMAVDWWALGIFVYELLAGYTPFHGKTDLETYDQILDGIFSYPSFFSSEAKDIVDKLLEPSKSLRLGNQVGGVEDIKRHPFFKSINWEKLYRKEIEPPAVPKLEGDGDFSHFDSDFEDMADVNKKRSLFSDW